jgi:two-component system, OmpR family, sensor histidine kinase CiaH
MFHQARVKLTLWYLLIIMLISAAFSVVIYRALTGEIDRVEHLQRMRLQRLRDEGIFIPVDPPQYSGSVRIYDLDPNLITETKNRIIIILFGINVVILLLSSGAGYLLAGRTLKPIKEMTDEQDRFIADASHELRTPLTALRTELEVSMMDKRLTLKAAKVLLASNLEEVERLQNLSDRLLILTRQDHPGNLRKKEVSLSNVINRAIHSIQSSAKKKNISIDNGIIDYTLSGDENRFTELFTILFDNAVKYSPEGGKLTLTSEQADHHIKVLVTDNGIGIHKKDLRHIFERFYRADMSRSKTNEQGFGLGLSIAKEIIDLYDGSISVDSKVGKGSTFVVTLPLVH